MTSNLSCNPETRGRLQRLAKAARIGVGLLGRGDVVAGVFVAGMSFNLWTLYQDHPREVISLANKVMAPIMESQGADGRFVREAQAVFPDRITHVRGEDVLAKARLMPLASDDVLVGEAARTALNQSLHFDKKAEHDHRAMSSLGEIHQPSVSYERVNGHLHAFVHDGVGLPWFNRQLMQETAGVRAKEENLEANRLFVEAHEAGHGIITAGLNSSHRNLMGLFNDAPEGTAFEEETADIIGGLMMYRDAMREPGAPRKAMVMDSIARMADLRILEFVRMSRIGHSIGHYSTAGLDATLAMLQHDDIGKKVSAMSLEETALLAHVLAGRLGRQSERAPDGFPGETAAVRASLLSMQVQLARRDNSLLAEMTGKLGLEGREPGDGALLAVHRGLPKPFAQRLELAQIRQEKIPMPVGAQDIMHDAGYGAKLAPNDFQAVLQETRRLHDLRQAMLQNTPNRRALKGMAELFERAADLADPGEASDSVRDMARKLAKRPAGQPWTYAELSEGANMFRMVLRRQQLVEPHLGWQMAMFGSMMAEKQDDLLKRTPMTWVRPPER